MLRNEGDIVLPLMNGASRNYQTAISSTIVSAGVYLDPFIFSIRHSCDSNSWVIFESNHLRVRALKAISTGTEITLSQLRTLGIGQTELNDYGCRKSSLAKINLDCECDLCQRGKITANSLSILS